MLKKGLALGVVVLFLGIAFAPSITANVDNIQAETDFVEITSKIIGTKKGEEHTIKLTNEESIELDNLISDIKNKLDHSNSRVETVEIFNDTIVELDQYGLLGDMSVKEVQKLIDGGYNKIGDITHIRNKLFDDSENSNSNCLFAGDTQDYTSFGGKVPLIDAAIAGALQAIFNFFETVLPNGINGTIGTLFVLGIGLPIIVVILLHMLIRNIMPFTLLNHVFFGEKYFQWSKMGPPEPKIEYHPCSGWIWTQGTNGVMAWEGSFYGDIKPNEGTSGFRKRIYCTGATGFSGIKIWKGSGFFLLGHALKASFSYEYPFD